MSWIIDCLLRRVAFAHWRQVTGAVHPVQLYRVILVGRQCIVGLTADNRATAWQIDRTPSLCFAFSRWNAAVRREIPRIRPISQADLPWADHSRHSNSRGDHATPSPPRSALRLRRAWRWKYIAMTRHPWAGASLVGEDGGW